jgi:PAS domain S-box-containing protein
MPSPTIHDGKLSWLSDVLAAVQDGAVVFDPSGRVLAVNESFTELLGYTMDDGPLVPPYPWWATPEEDAEALAGVLSSWQECVHGNPVSGEARLYRSDRRPVWVQTSAVLLDAGQQGFPAGLQTFRGIGREKASQERRLAAAEVSSDLSLADDLETVLGVAEAGFSLLFDGGTTVQLNIASEPLFLTGSTPVSADELPEEVRRGLAGRPSPDAVARRPGILLVPPSTEADCRAWIQFAKPRRISPDELIVADLLAQAFALAVDKVLLTEQAADQKGHLERAVESHRVVGQAVGILMERHRLTSHVAFQRLRSSSHNRNLKLRELADRVIESGLEPEQA